MATVYPADTDTLTQMPHRSDGDTIFAAEQNTQIDAIIALEAVLGDDDKAAGTVRHILENTTDGHDHDGTDSNFIQSLVSSLYLTASGNTTLSPDGSNNCNDLAITSNTVHRLTTSGATNNVTGFAAPSGGAASGRGRLIVIHNVDSTFSVVLKSQHASSTSTNRLILNADITLGPNQSTLLMYDTTTSRWRCVGGVGGSGGSSGGAPTDAAYLIGATSGVSSLTNETLVGSTPNGDLGGTASVWSAIVIRDLHGDDVQGHHEEDHAYNSAVHTNLSFPTPIVSAIAAAVGSTGLAHGDHVHPLQAGGLASITSNIADITNTQTDTDIVLYNVPANFVAAGQVWRFEIYGRVQNTTGATGSTSVRFRIKCGSTTIATMDVAIGDNTDKDFYATGLIIFRSTTSAYASMAMTRDAANSGNVDGNSHAVVTGLTTTSAFDLKMTGTWASQTATDLHLDVSMATLTLVKK